MLSRVAGSVGDYNLSLGEIYRAFMSTGIRIPNGFPVTGWAEGRYEVDGRPNTLADIRVSIFCVGTVWDHVAPWHSVYKIHLFADTCVTFVLTTGSHNAGIVSEPGHQHRSFQIETKNADERYVDADTWQATAPKTAGSWWPAWQSWLVNNSTGVVPAPALGSSKNDYPPLGDAPGTCVLQE